MFGEWLGEFSLYLSASELSAETPLSENSFGGVEAAAPGGVKESLADAALLRAESRARSGMRSAFSLLKEYIDANVKSDVRSGGQDQDPFLSSKLWVPHFPSNGTGMAFADAPVASPRDLRPLREHIELQGFLPLNKQYMVFVWCLLVNELIVAWCTTGIFRKWEHAPPGSAPGGSCPRSTLQCPPRFLAGWACACSGS